ncbi:hypothetical protein BDR05DRAFT_948264 [Suillus weaverae]|nr:hypothetical protein BDR05DRAFT_948264 [Suillus weaverae]
MLPREYGQVMHGSVVSDFARFSIYSITSTLSRAESRLEPGRWLRGDAKAIVDGVRVSDSRMEDTRDMVIDIEDTSYESMLIGNPRVIPAPRNKNQNNNDSKSNDAANWVAPLRKTFECPKSVGYDEGGGVELCENGPDLAGFDFDCAGFLVQFRKEWSTPSGGPVQWAFALP